ncbi:hypothetical protein H6G33_29305 [Calothrix sp. FACHB-1219]|uniref:hypothetical protein n=1 Tax=unclassified Calothrix TaxID=2619626 RepID=UPI0016885FA6|nr:MULTISPECIES: hypothetical protein [unclassified Calothrix]MBD2206297.1 hypothetical protein [Calothrix sp. FACHB-168]MBD2221079.1 hypothetical protein [Calothrix sp. FACHB-1219]
MNINDLTYIEAATEEVFGGRGSTTKNKVTLTVDAKTKVLEKITVKLDTDLKLEGYVATATATADTVGGKAGFSSTTTNAQVDGNTTSALSQSTAAIESGYRR